MSTKKDNSNVPLASFASLIGVIGLLLYYSGWIYRWSYLDFFAVNINAFSFGFESFVLVTLQTFLGDWQRIITFVILVLFAIIVTRLILLVLQYINKVRRSLRIRYRSISLLQHKLLRVLNGLNWVTGFLSKDVIDDLIIIGVILVSLFYFSSYQGRADAMRDVFDSSSTRPMITIVGSEDKLLLGKLPSDPTLDSPKDKIKIIGDIDAFDEIISSGISDVKQGSTWRLLGESGNWLYLYKSLDKNDPKNNISNTRPYVVVVNAGDGRVQFRIISQSKNIAVPTQMK
jgi:hypothetical protein